MTLLDVSPGVAIVLRRPDLPPSVTRRLAELGLRPGVVATVLRRTVRGGRLVAVGDVRVALGRTVAGQFPVGPLP